MTPPNTAVPIDPVAALNAVMAENEWRRNRMLLLEQEIVTLRRRLRELEAAKPAEASAKPAKPAAKDS